MTQKSKLLAAFMILAGTCSVGAYAYSVRQSESERCFESIEIGEEFTDVKNRLVQNGFTHVGDTLKFAPDRWGRSQPVIFIYHHLDEQRELRIEVKNDCVASKYLLERESVTKQVWQWVREKMQRSDSVVKSVPLPSPSLPPMTPTEIVRVED